MVELHKIDSNVKILISTGDMVNSTNKEFIFSYWKKYDGLKSKINLPTFRRLTDPESISRSKRKLVESNPIKYRPTSVKVLQGKRKRERTLRKHYGS